MDLKLTMVNLKTREKAEIKFVPRSGSKVSSIEVKFLNSSGKQTHEISGSWQNQLELKTLSTGQKETIWEESLELIDDHDC